MNSITLKKLEIENFKGCKNRVVEFGNKTVFSGQNASGKTTIIDSLMWVLFDKDSLGSTKFQVRPLDLNGDPVHHVEIKVAATIDNNGTEYVLSKVQKEKWVKKRGSETQEFQGNVNEFEINGYPKSEKDFKSFISDIVDEELFRMITNPVAFTSLAWKKQREILFKLVTEVSDIDIACRNTEFGPLVQELHLASIDDVKAKYVKAKNELTKKQIELPVRIDEISKNIISVDIAEFELQKSGLEREIAELNEKLTNELKQLEEKQQAADKIMEMKFELSDMERKANADVISTKNDVARDIQKKKFDLTTFVSNNGSKQREIENLKNQLVSLDAKKQRLKNDYKNAKDREFDNSTLVCPYCGQEYPEDKKETLVSEFETHKQEEVNNIVLAGKQVANDITNLQSLITSAEKEFEELTDTVKKLQEEITVLEKKYSEIPESIDMTTVPEYVALQNDISEKEKAMNEAFSFEDSRNAIKAELQQKSQELKAIEIEIVKADCSQYEQRKEELETELREVGQKIANVEKMLYLVEKFTKAKLDAISDMVNSKFQIVNWKLFSQQINGGIAECCECTVNGVPFSALNNGHRIAAGIDIVRTLSGIYGVSAPICVDNAEAINSYYVPETNSQMILLKVTEDKEIQVEVNE